MRKNILFLLLPSFLLFFSPTVWAKLFSNKFIEFQLPEQWQCQLDGSEWVCQSQNEEKKRDAIIVLAAKIRSKGQDSLASYKAHLEKPQSYTSASGQQVISEARYAKESTINNRKWVDSLHLHSEIPDFYTRYLATTANDLGILLTFSVRKDKYAEYGPQIDALLRSLKAFRRPGNINATAGGDLFEGGGTEKYLQDEVLFPEEKPCPKGQRRSPKDGQCKQPKPKSDGEGEDMFFLLLLLALAAGAFIYIKKRKKS